MAGLDREDHRRWAGSLMTACAGGLLIGLLLIGAEMLVVGGLVLVASVAAASVISFYAARTLGLRFRELWRRPSSTDDRVPGNRLEALAARRPVPLLAFVGWTMLSLLMMSGGPGARAVGSLVTGGIGAAAVAWTRPSPYRSPILSEWLAVAVFLATALGAIADGVRTLIGQDPFVQWSMGPATAVWGAWLLFGLAWNLRRPRRSR